MTAWVYRRIRSSFTPNSVGTCPLNDGTSMVVASGRKEIPAAINQGLQTLYLGPLKDSFPVELKKPPKISNY